MNRRFLFFLALAMAATIIAGAGPALAGPGTRAAADAGPTPSGGTFFANSPAGSWVYTSVTGSTNPLASNSGTPLRKFIDALPLLCSQGTNTLGQCLPVAKPDTTTYANSDYYEIGLRDYTEKLHSDLPKATRLRGYYQKNTADAFASTNHYLGPIILATKNRPVRIKFFNELGASGAGGELFIPVDHTYMGAGVGPDGRAYPENRATLHLHGGHTPWISDGTPHQWVAPAAENPATSYIKGDSQQNVPDMDGGVEPAGVETFYWTNNQSDRLMFYHDHAYGITRLNVYAGEAAGYLIIDPTEENALAAAGVPGTMGTTPDPTHLVPLVIQDKTFVPADIAVQDAKWTNPNWGVSGDLWFPHVYETNQWPTNPDLSGANNFGRWDYGPWFWPVFPVAIPGLPTMNVSGVPEGFMDTPVINGTAYPYMNVQPQAYRFRILNAANDRMWNLSLFTADTGTGAYISPDTGLPTEIKMVPAIPRAACSATVTTNCVCTPPTYAPAGCFPPTWPTDSRPEGVPDPANMGPDIIQIGTEGGLLPQAVVIPPQPVNYEYNRRNIVVLNVTDHGLFLGPAERADVIIDFSQFAGKTVILYNDSPAPVPAFDPRFDYYTGDPDNTWMGGAPSTPPGLGPNTRTIMQFRVANTTPSAPISLATLTAAMPAIYTASQHPPVVPETAYPAGYNAPQDTYSRIQDTSLTFTNLASGATVTMHMLSKTIQELFTADYGRMNATLGTELPFTNALIQTTIPLGYIDPPTEILRNNQPQIWKITHNGVDTHAIHVHLFDVQVINRVGWDGAIRPPDANELGWKDTVRMNPLEDIIVALRPTTAPVPFPLPDSIRALDVTMPLGTTAQFTGVDPYTGNPITVTNELTNFGYEYVWHCHLLGHEENDMMRPTIFKSNDRVGIYAAGSNTWYLDGNGTGAWEGAPGDKMVSTFNPGVAGTAVFGDWDGSGATKIGIFNAGTWYLDYNGDGVWDPAVDKTVSFGVGLAGVIPVVGDWTGSGTTKVGVFQPSTGLWFLDLNGNFAWDGTPTDGLFTFGVGLTGALPVVGDWTGNGISKIGVFETSTGIWYLDKNGSGAWDGQPTDVAYTFGAGVAGAVPVVGDWTGDGISKVGIYVNGGTWYLDLSGNGAWDGTPTDRLDYFGSGLSGAVPVSGKW